MDLDNLKNNPELIKTLIETLSALLPQEQDNSFEVKPTNKPKTKSKSLKKKSGEENVNLFDKMPERKLHKEDTAIDKKLITQPPTERARQFFTIDVVCRVCGKKETVNPSLVFDKSRYKCNVCSSSGG